MAQVTRSANKTKFETGDVPTQNDFIDLLDSIFHMASDTLDVIPQGTNNKWVTTSQINTWNAKADAVHTHAISQITGLQSALDAKAALNHNHSISDITGLQAALNQKQTNTPLFFLSANQLSSIGVIPLLNIPCFSAIMTDGQTPIVQFTDGGQDFGELPFDSIHFMFFNNSANAGNVNINVPNVRLTSGSIDFNVLPAGNIAVPATSVLIFDGRIALDQQNRKILIGEFKTLSIADGGANDGGGGVGENPDQNPDGGDEIVNP